MNYQDWIDKAIEFVEDVPFGDGEGVYDPESGCNIICVHLSGRIQKDAENNIERYFLFVRLKTMQVGFHYGGHDWGYTFPTFHEVGQFIQPYYQSWLNRKGYELVTQELDEAPWVIDLLKKEEDR